MAEQYSMETTITRRKWTWMLTMRKAGSSITKKALRWTPQGCRDRGRPKNTWKRTVERELGLGSMKLSWSKAERRHRIGRSGGVSSAACAPAGVERQRRRRISIYLLKKLSKIIFVIFSSNFDQLSYSDYFRHKDDSLNLYEVHSFSTSPNSRQRTTVLNADVPNCSLCQ